MSQDTQQLSRRGCVAALAGAPLLAGAETKIMVAGHPWVYAARCPKNDIYEILDQIFADMHAAGLDAIELILPGVAKSEGPSSFPHFRTTERIRLTQEARASRNERNAS